MTTVCEKGKCTGCMECIDVCPKKAIKVIDSWMEYNAVIDSEKCIQCNACHSACQIAFVCVLHLEELQQQ